jgi:hypothetical protein
MPRCRHFLKPEFCGTETLLEITRGKGVEAFRRVQALLQFTTANIQHHESVIAVEAVDTLIGGGGIFGGSAP